MTITIRDATKTDTPLILKFIRELAIYENAEHEVVANESSIEATIFCAESGVKALICEKDTVPIGFAVYFFNYSTWLGKHGLYLEDLYVTPVERRSGVGRALFAHLARIALEKGCSRFEWSVLDWNEPAIGFYQSLGARPKDEWTTYQLTGEALHAVANASMPNS